MNSVWGVDHGEVSKAAWKAFYPVPPRVGKIPRSKLKIDTKGSGGDYDHTAKTLRGKSVGLISTSPRAGDSGTHVIEYAATNPGFRRRNVASTLIAHGEKTTGADIMHSSSRTPNGNAFAQGHDKKRGLRPAALDPWMAAEKKSKKSKAVRWTTRDDGGRGSTRRATGALTGRSGIERGKKRNTPLSERNWA